MGGSPPKKRRSKGGVSSSSGLTSLRAPAPPPPPPPPTKRVVPVHPFFGGNVKDNTTEKSRKQDKIDAILKTKMRNPDWKPVDHKVFFALLYLSC